MNASRAMLELAGELVERRSPNVFLVFGLEHGAQPVYDYLRQHAEIGAVLDQDSKTLCVEIADIFDSAIIKMIDRGKLKPVIDPTPEVEAELAKMRARAAKSNPPPEPVAEVPVVPPTPVKTKAQIELALDDAFVIQYKQNYSKEFRDATKRDAKQRARMERLIAAGRI